MLGQERFETIGPKPINMGSFGMKTTMELPDDLLRTAKSLAAAKGCSLKDFFTEALKDKLNKEEALVASTDPPWMSLSGAFGRTKKSREETRLIQQRIDEEFGQIDPLE